MAPYSPRTKKHLLKWKNENKSSKKDALERLAKRLLDQPELLPPCMDLFTVHKSTKEFPITFQLEKQVEKAALGKGDAIVLLGYLVQDNLKIPVALKLAFFGNENPPSDEEEDQRDNSGEIEFAILYKIRDIILNQESPNFILPLAFRECNLEEIFNQKGLNQVFVKNVLPIYAKFENSPSFDRSNVLITIMERGKQTLYSLMKQITEQYSTFEEFRTKFMDPVLFQIGNAFHVLVAHGIVHHDAHMNNIFVDETKGRVLFFKNSWDDISSEFYEVHTDWTPKVFDFDQAFLKGSENLGLTNTALCQQHKICNTFNKKWDLFRFLKNFYGTLYSIVRKSVFKTKASWSDDFLRLGVQRKWFNEEFFLDFDKIPEVDFNENQRSRGVDDSKFASLPMFLHSFEKEFAIRTKPTSYYTVKTSL